MKTASNGTNGRRHRVGTYLAATCLSSCLLLTATTAAAGTLEKIAQSGSVTIGYQLAFPFAYHDSARRPIGYTIDLCHKVVEAIKRDLKRPDLVINYKQVTAAMSILELASGDIDIECSNTTNTTERRTMAAFTIPTFIAAARMIVRADSGIKSVNDLAGKTAVTTQGSNSEEVFNNLNETRGLNVKLTVLTKEYADSFAAVEDGRADAFIQDDLLLYSLRAASKHPEKFEITRDALSVEPMSIMLRKDDPAFKKLVDAEILRIIMQGEINTIYRKWFESPIPPKMLNLKMPMSYTLRDSFKIPTDWLPN